MPGTHTHNEIHIYVFDRFVITSIWPNHKSHPKPTKVKLQPVVAEIVSNSIPKKPLVADLLFFLLLILKFTGLYFLLHPPCFFPLLLHHLHIFPITSTHVYSSSSKNHTTFSLSFLWPMPRPCEPQQALLIHCNSSRTT